MSTTRQDLITLIDNGNVEANNIPKALELSGVSPNKPAWTNFLNNGLSWLGGLAISLSVIFFIAFNWDGIGRFAKFAALQFIIVLSIGLYLFYVKKELSKKVLLTMASLFTGALIAYLHQTYQTGADPWQLFFTWSVLIIPWVVAAQFAPLWFLLVVLANITIYTYQFIANGIFGIVFDSELSLLWTGFIFNGLVLIVWELAATRFDYLQTRWVVRLIALGAGFAVSFLCLLHIFEYRHVNATVLAPLAWLLTISAIYWFYRKIKPDLFMLVAGCLSIIVLVDCYLGKHLLKDFDFGGLLVLALFTVGMGGASAMYLRKLHKEFHHA